MTNHEELCSRCINYHCMCRPCKGKDKNCFAIKSCTYNPDNSECSGFKPPKSASVILEKGKIL